MLRSAPRTVMQIFAGRLFLLSGALVIGLSCDGTAVAQPAASTATPEDRRLLVYAEPGLRVDIGGRHINLTCAGANAGAPTVIFLSGLSSWAPVWYKTQPEIAKRTRACAFDRAGYGFSDPAPRLQILPDVVDDVHAALTAAGIQGPYVLVGHSLGGLEARMFAQRWPNEVAGMVLVDTSPAAELLIEADIPGVDDALSLERIIRPKLWCTLQAARGVDPSSAEYRVCVQPLPSDTPVAFRRDWPKFFTADYHAAQVALLSSLATYRHSGADRLQLGDMPLVVLSLDLCCLGASPEDNFWRAYRETWYALHQDLARMSTRGVHRVVEGAGHQIELDKPQAVIDAVDEVLRTPVDGSRSPAR
ncbi:MAG: alpha/beta hydrolase [Rhodospirillaceae bacterium]|nr:alpha/beta hydrolase [Rhodospirillaceae bacterium]